MKGEHSVTQEFFLLLDPAQVGGFEHASAAIREAGARILEAAPPNAAVVEMDPARAQALVYTAGLRGAYSHLISDAHLERMPADARPAALAWNARQRGRALDGDKAGLAWDAPGHLPPDLPPDIWQSLDDDMHAS